MVVNSTTLDELLKSEASFDCIKIDMKDAELEVLRGAKDALKRTKYLVIEVSHNVSEILKILEKACFKCKKAHFTTYVLCKRSETSNSHEDLQKGPTSNMLIHHEREIIHRHQLSTTLHNQACHFIRRKRLLLVQLPKWK